MSILAFFRGKGASGYGWASTAEEVTEGVDLTGKRYLVTGCNSGLGLETMRVLAMRGATVVGSARTEAKAREACEKVEGDTVPVTCELVDPASIRACIDTVRSHGEPLDAIIANAGIMMLPKREVLFGCEKQLFVNHVAHFILIDGLIDTLAADGRVVCVASEGHNFAPKQGIKLDDLAYEDGYKPIPAYGQSKLANILFARELSRRLGDSERIAVALHPGSIPTNLTRHSKAMEFLSGLFAPLTLKTIPQGAATQVWAAAVAEPSLIDGEYLVDVNVGKSSRHGRDMDLAAKLWDATEAVVRTID